MGKEPKPVQDDYDINSYAYELPPRLIAQKPVADRDASRLLVFDGRSRTLEDRHFPDILHYLQPGDLLVVNNTRVFPARIMGAKETGGKIELFLLEYPQGESKDLTVTALVKSSKRPKPGSRLLLAENLEGRVAELLPEGKIRVKLTFDGNIDDILTACGQIPLPPYIHRPVKGFSQDRERYQTVYASRTGAVAAPTAGLHFSQSLLDKITAAGAKTAAVTLHVGYGTFAPVRVNDIRRHVLHEEYTIIPSETAQLVNETKQKGGKVWAVGTTTARTLEFGADGNGLLRGGEGWCNLYIYPGYPFKIIDNLITNFHLPGSSLLFLVAALVGRERLLAGYRQAVDLNYRFFSYGDAMAIIR